jgi:hypothetical protein
MQSREIVNNLRIKYSWLSYEEMFMAYEFAVSDYYMYKYPSENNRPKYNATVDLDFYASQWVQQRMIDILERAGGSSVTSYSENGLSWTYAKSHIDPALVSMIMPKAATPK